MIILLENKNLNRRIKSLWCLSGRLRMRLGCQLGSRLGMRQECDPNVDLECNSDVDSECDLRLGWQKTRMATRYPYPLATSCPVRTFAVYIAVLPIAVVLVALVWAVAPFLDPCAPLQRVQHRHFPALLSFQPSRTLTWTIDFLIASLWLALNYYYYYYY